MITLNDYSINSINTDEVLRLLQYYLRKVAEFQYISEYNTNNILTSFISQLWNLQNLVFNIAPIYRSILSVIIFEILFFINTPVLNISLCCPRPNISLLWSLVVIVK